MASLSYESKIEGKKLIGHVFFTEKMCHGNVGEKVRFIGQFGPMFFRFRHKVQMMFVGGALILLFSAFTPEIIAEQHRVEAESAELIGNSSKVPDERASGGYSVSLTKTGEGIEFTNMPAAAKK